MSKPRKASTKFIVVTGGVLSGLGKGIAAASIGNLLSGRLKVIPVKCDGYLNTDPGTMNPIEHGEVFVQDDGGEVDMDFGHYERFMGIETKFHWNLTMGKVFKNILDKERRGDYLGKTVQFIPHVTDSIKNWFHEIASKENADVLLIEVGGTVGDLENQFYLEAIRQLKRDVGEDNLIYVHLTYVPVPEGVHEQKSKPTQMSVRLLNEKGIEPDIIIGRCPELLNPSIKEKIASYCNISPSAVISGPDVRSVYEIPLIYEKEGLPELLHTALGIYSPPDLRQWDTWVSNIKNNQDHPRKTVTIALCGKYTTLEDSYASVVEALTHCGAHLNCKVAIKWVDTAKLADTASVEAALQGAQGVIVPGGFGHRGIEGKIKVIQYVREKNIPYLGICYGMQLAVVEFARHVAGLKDANTTEVREEGVAVPHPVIDILPGQKNLSNKGGTMRLGGHDVEIKPNSVAYRIFGNKAMVRQRFRHRYEVNPEYIKPLEDKGLVFSGKHPTENIMQVMELPDHKFFMGSQFHPELTSNLRNPSPLFYHLVKAALSE
ncbi:MAG TPA: CTP synthase (glutamine hydrolyzing) [Fibrobacteria bacterium]|nr:CTP synthase (glutamine hydrolyzing) [Fibrobacteria bacterium]